MFTNILLGIFSIAIVAAIVIEISWVFDIISHLKKYKDGDEH